MNSIYITSSGSFLPGNPINNNEIENYLGLINGKPSRTKKRILKQNGIKTRHFAIDKQQNSTSSNTEMAVKAINDCLSKSNITKKEVDFLATGTTQGDLPIPGFASMVHAESGFNECEISSHQSVCSASMMALKNCYQNILAGSKKNAIACASDFPSRLFKGLRFENQKRELSLQEDFLRWMLSDGAGALLLQDKPSSQNISLKINWIDIRSYANKYGTCMYAGTNNPQENKTWLDYNSFESAAFDGAINLRQDLKLVNDVVKVGVDHYFELIDNGMIKVKKIDHLLCHYSSHHFKQPILDLIEKGGAMISADKWFTNLYSKGNTGAASIFIMIDEFLNKKIPKDGDHILLMVPESGRFVSTYMHCTVQYPNATNKAAENDKKEKIVPPKLELGNKKPQQWLVRQLAKIWIDYETRLNKIPVVNKLNTGTITINHYRRLLLNLRQQVMDGAQWIARAASNVDIEFFDSRSAFISHAREEHRDFKMLEKNFVACGGNLEEIQNGQKNIGSEALSAWMFHRASQRNPFDLLGAMFIIEGMGNRIANRWGEEIKKQLSLDDKHVSFFTYHGSADENHFERLESALSSNLLTMDIAKQIVKTAKVTSRLYLLQLEEIDNF
tara:strand:- start:2020 stop:3867 length:1848 start_codon:yes stop_codon:yes gene_type:complete